jgi:hypothetical protein
MHAYDPEKRNQRSFALRDCDFTEAGIAKFKALADMLAGGVGAVRVTHVRDHEYIKTGDPDAHPAICDENGEVVLQHCRVCGQAEGGLADACPGPAAPAAPMLSHDAIIFGMGHLNGAKACLSFGGDGAEMKITDRARAALNELLAAGYAKAEGGLNRWVGREYYRGVWLDPTLGELCREAEIDPLKSVSWATFERVGAPPPDEQADSAPPRSPLPWDKRGWTPK